MEKEVHTAPLLSIGEPILHYITVRYNDLNVLEFIFCKKAQIAGFIADLQYWFFLELYTEYYNHHAPYTAIFVCRDSPGLAINI